MGRGKGKLASHSITRHRYSSILICCMCGLFFSFSLSFVLLHGLAGDAATWGNALMSSDRSIILSTGEKIYRTPYQSGALRWRLPPSWVRNRTFKWRTKTTYNVLHSGLAPDLSHRVWADMCQSSHRCKGGWKNCRSGKGKFSIPIYSTLPSSEKKHVINRSGN